MDQTPFYIFCEGLSHYGSGGIALMASIFTTARAYESQKLEVTPNRILGSVGQVFLITFAAEVFSISIFDYFTGQFPS